jgi:DNA-binding MarR family transcriptional regulator
LAQKLQAEIRQTKPFASAAEEALLNLQRTADCFRRDFQQALKPYGITATQYNALRILRGAADEALTCSELGERLVSSDPDITRLLNRLQRRGLIERQRDTHDRRSVKTVISPAGLHLLQKLTPLIEEHTDERVRHMGQAKLEALIDLLEDLRQPLSSAEG